MISKAWIRTAAAATAGVVLAAGSPAQAATARYYSGEESVQIVQNFLQGASVGSITCGITGVVNRMKKFKGRAGLASIAAYSAQVSATTAGTSATCKLAKQLALAAATAATIDLAQGKVWIEDASTTDSCGLISKKITYTYRIGPSPAQTATFAGSVKVACWT